jgi:hypothetical protein
VQTALLPAIARAMLWYGLVPDDVAAAWADLRLRLLTTGDDWDVWVNWYEDRLAGRASLGEAFDIAVATLPDELWRQGPASVNARIKQLIAEHTPPEPIPAKGHGPRVERNPEASGTAPPKTRPPRNISRSSTQTPTTLIGKALHQRREEVLIALAAVTVLIDEKLAQLNYNPPNSDEARTQWDEAINELKELKIIVDQLRHDVHAYITGSKTEKDTVRTAKAFRTGIEEYWSKNSMKLIDRGLNAVQSGVSIGLFLAGVGACTAMGQGSAVTTAICGAIVGGKPVVEALRAIAQKTQKSRGS